jgi:hypothetical protein
MPPKISLLIGVHAHQPVGNFASVIGEAHERCYRPFLTTLYRYPAFHFAAHFSGWLLDELVARYPADMALLAAMVARGQVEMFGAGDCEPVLAAIPARDRRGQLAVLSEKLLRRFGERPRGAWLTERVWESSVVPDLAASGIRYVTVDDYHFLCTGRTAEELDGFYTTEENGQTVDLFPISEPLRYRLPFAPAAEVVRYLETQALGGARAAIYFDDIEKFGVWPETYDWVYTRGWLEQFIEGVLASPLIQTSTYAAFHARTPTRGIVYLPTASYSEMNQWTLPATSAGRYAQLLATLKTQPDFECVRPFIRGGIWRNFLSRYPESNWLHKRMLGLSARLAAAPPALANDPALRDMLYRGQANDAYWHGLFGGLYLPHLRRAVWRNLIALEAALDEGRPVRTTPAVDVDYDGAREVFLANAHCQVVLRDDGLGAAHELTSYPLRHNFGDTLRRHAEHYHQLPPAGLEDAQPSHGGIASAHDRLAFKTPLVAADLAVDPHGRVLFSDTVYLPDGASVPLDAYRLGERTSTSVTFWHALSGDPEAIGKTWRLEAQGISLAYTTRLPDGAYLGSELNLALPSCEGFGGRYTLADGSFPGGFGQTVELAAVCELSMEDAELLGRVRLVTSSPVHCEAKPHFTVSQSEAGLEKIMQAACLKLSWASPQLNVRLSLESCPSWL